MEDCAVSWQERWEVAGGSVPGREHLRAGRNNQDAFHWTLLGDPSPGLVAVVCDGCSSGRHSEVGAQLGARLAVATLTERLSLLDGERGWDRVHRDLLAELAVVASRLGPDRRRAVLDYLLFTICGAVITPTLAYLFSLGDGEVFLNEKRLGPGRAENNEPRYIGYGLLQGSSSPPPWDLLAAVPTGDVRSLLVGSDGVEDLLKAEGRLLPGTAGRVDSIAEFWSEDAYFDNPDRIRRRLTLVARDALRAEGGEVRRSSGHLSDDTTLVVIRRRRPVAAGS
jgi:hypothetical protein